jgi:LAO/AO transport system kinase
VARRADTAGVLAGNRISIARAISLVENDEPEAESFLRSIYTRTGRACRIGITGPPGAGKSTLTTRLASSFRREGLSVGIIAVDPTSPFTGGAVLGDRVRMSDVELDEGVFIRSMASRGNPGGLSRAAGDAADILDAAGMDIVLFETVGVGQSELDIARAADVTVVVLVPESGDAVQAMKAGLMEIADIFVMNKSDRPGAEQAAQALTSTLMLRQSELPAPEVVRTVAHEGKGIEGVSDAIRQFRARLEADGSGTRRRRERLETRIADIVVGRVRRTLWTPERRAELSEAVDAVIRGELTPFDVAHRLINTIGTSPS